MKRLLLFSIAIIFFHVVHSQQVRVYEGKEIIPTYQLGANELSPIFYTGRDVQGAAGHFYPYPAQVKLGEKITNVTYDMVYLEILSGNSEKANQLFNELIQTGQNIIDKNIDDSGVNKSLSKGYYYLALGKMGNGEDAKPILSKSLKAYKNNLWAKQYLLSE